MIQQTTLPPVPALADLPAFLVARDQWVAWKSIPDRDHPEKKPKKLPINPHTGTAGSSTDPDTWGTVQEALVLAEVRGLAGVGVVVTDENGEAWVDADGCLNAEGVIAEWWANWHEALLPLAYAEVSPSGTGIKYWTRARVAEALNRKFPDGTGVECYSWGRYFTVTGKRVEGCADEPQDAQEVVDALLVYFAPPTKTETLPPPAPPPAAAPALRAAEATGWRADRAHAVDAQLRDWVERKVETAAEQMRLAVDGTRHNRRLQLGELLGGVIAAAPGYLDDQRAEAVIMGARVPEAHYATELKTVRTAIEHGKQSPVTDLPTQPTDQDPIVRDGRALCPRCSTAIRRSKFDYPGTTTAAWYCPRCKGDMLWPPSAWSGPALVGDEPTHSSEGEAPRSRFILRTEDDLASVAPPEWLLTDEIQRRGYHLIYGASGSGKTFYALDRTMRAASTGARCLYVATEDLAGLKMRVAAWRYANPNTPGRITWLEMPEGINLADAVQVDELIGSIAGLSFDLITIDTLREAHAGDENSSQDMAAVNRAIQRIIRETGAAVDVVHHSGVNEGRERGSTALSANCDLKWRVGNDDGRVIITCEKFRHGPLFTPRHYHITPTPEVVGGAVLRPASSISNRPSGVITAGERSILEMLALSIFDDIGAKTTQVQQYTNLQGGSLYRALASLKTRGYLIQSTKGDPYTITVAGRAALSPSHEPTPTYQSVAGYSETTTTPDTASGRATTTTTSQLPPTTTTNSSPLTSTTTTTTTRKGGSSGSGSELWEMEESDAEDDLAPPQQTTMAMGVVERLAAMKSDRKDLADKYEQLTGHPPPSLTNEALRAEVERLCDEEPAMPLQKHAAD